MILGCLPWPAKSGAEGSPQSKTLPRLRLSCGDAKRLGVCAVCRRFRWVIGPPWTFDLGPSTRLLFHLIFAAMLEAYESFRNPTNHNTMTRSAFLAASALFSVAAFLPAADAPPPLKVLMVTGGCCHDYEMQKMILSEGLSARANVEFTIIHEEGPNGKKDKTHRISIYEKDGWADGYDIVLHNECFGGIEDNTFVERIAKPHEEGVPAVMLHCSAHSYRAASTDAWRLCLGQKSMSHEKNRDLVIENIAPDHPVMKGFPAKWNDKADELYKNEILFDRFVPLAKSFGQDTQKDHQVIWVNEVGKGKVFGTTLGHNNSTMEDPVFLDLVARGLLWACGKLGEDGKPLAGYESQQK